MRDQEIYELLIKTDNGYDATEDEKTILKSIKMIRWYRIERLPQCLYLLSEVTDLELIETNVSDISALSRMVSLKSLELSHVRNLMDISALSELNTLTSLDLQWTSVGDISALSRLTALTNLDLQGTLVSDISALSNLTALTKLDLSGTRVGDISALSGLTALTNLDLRGTKVSDISALAGLTGLRNLDLQWTRVSDIGVLSNLKALTQLDLSRNYNLSDINVLSALRELKSLNLRWTNVSDISALSGLSKLTYLDLSGNENLADISALSRLTALNKLGLSGNENLTDISVLSCLTALTNLDLSSNENLTDISTLADLTALTTLDLRWTNVSDIRVLSDSNALTNLALRRTKVNDISALSGLTSLIDLDLRDLTLTSIPECLINIGLDFLTEEDSSAPGIHIHGLKLTEQPIEIFSQSRELIQAFYREQEKVPVNECKVVFLGDPESGKTHSIKRLLQKGAKLEELKNQSTPGIEITVDTMKLEDSDIVVNYWDFGGQEIQHSMHRMFLTERTIYVVFLNARQDPLDDRARYWLENICSFANDAPVLLIINKMDQNGQPKFNEDGIRNDYGSRIKKIVRMSALEDEPDIFMKELQGSINEIIKELPTVSSLVPRSWKALMEDIRTISNHYLTADQFKKRCNICNVQAYNTIHDDLVDLFQIIGISFCYYKDRAIADYMLLNPKWLVNAIYTIISNSQTAVHNGVITQGDLYDLLYKDTLRGAPIKRVIPDLRYESGEVNYILGVIRMFHLSYPMKDGSEFFPMLCDGNEKVSVERVVSENALHYIFRFTYLPANVMHRLVVEMQKDLDERYVWYSGAVFRNDYQQQTAYIHTKGNDLHIYVDTLDPYYNPNEYLTPIQSIVRAINSDMNLSAEEYVTYREGDAEAEIDAEELKGNLQSGIERGFNKKLKRVIDYKDVARLYNDIRPKIKEDLLQNILKALSLMQNNMFYYKTPENSQDLENLRNTYVSEKVLMAGYICNDQQPGGNGEGGRRPGERDIVFRNKNGHDILIYEGLNLSGTGTANADRHLHKLMENYNPQGLPYGVLVTYVDCERTKFRQITDEYQQHITGYAPEKYTCIGQPRNIPTIGQYLRCLEMDYECGDQYFTIYHILVGMFEIL